MEENKKYMTIKEYSEMVGLSYSFIREKCLDNTIPCIKVGNRLRINVERAEEALAPKAKTQVPEPIMRLGEKNHKPSSVKEMLARLEMLRKGNIENAYKMTAAAKGA